MDVCLESDFLSTALYQPASALSMLLLRTIYPPDFHQPRTDVAPHMLTGPLTILGELILPQRVLASELAVCGFARGALVGRLVERVRWTERDDVEGREPLTIFWTTSVSEGVFRQRWRWALPSA